jgi:hypothetical protein
MSRLPFFSTGVRNGSVELVARHWGVLISVNGGDGISISFSFGSIGSGSGLGGRGGVCAAGELSGDEKFVGVCIKGFVPFYKYVKSSQTERWNICIYIPQDHFHYLEPLGCLHYHQKWWEEESRESCWIHPTVLHMQRTTVHPVLMSLTLAHQST